jgi:predicted transcriptional regulator
MVQHEFNNRIAAQRAILRVINRKSWSNEQLFGLSSKAIDRWVSVNRIEPGSRLVKLIRDVSAKLFFLANKSQEQVSDEYTAVRAEIAAIYVAIRIEFDGPAI